MNGFTAPYGCFESLYIYIYIHTIFTSLFQQLRPVTPRSRRCHGRCHARSFAILAADDLADLATGAKDLRRPGVNQSSININQREPSINPRAEPSSDCALPISNYIISINMSISFKIEGCYHTCWLLSHLLSLKQAERFWYGLKDFH